MIKDNQNKDIDISLCMHEKGSLMISVHNNYERIPICLSKCTHLIQNYTCFYFVVLEHKGYEPKMFMWLATDPNLEDAQCFMYSLMMAMMTMIMVCKYTIYVHNEEWRGKKTHPFPYTQSMVAATRNQVILDHVADETVQRGNKHGMRNTRVASS